VHSKDRAVFRQPGFGPLFRKIRRRL